MAFLLNDVENAIIKPLIADFDTYIVAPVMRFLNTYIINPLNSFINGVWSTFMSIYQQVLNVGSAVANISNGLMGIYNSIVNAFNSNIVQPLQNFFSGSIGFLSGIPSILGQIWGFISTIGTWLVYNLNAYVTEPLQNFFSSSLSFLSGIPAALGQVWNTISGLGDYVISNVSGLLGQIRSGLSTISSDILNGLNTYVIIPLKTSFSDVANGVVQIGQTLSNVGVAVVSGFNQLATGLNSITSDFTGAMGTLATAIWQGLQDALAFTVKSFQVTWQVVWQPAFNWVFDVLKGIYSFIHTGLRDALLAVLPKDPTEALDRAFDAILVGVGLTLTGEIAGIALDASHPVKKWGLQEAVHKGMDLLGVSSVASAMYGIVVSAGWGQQLRYFFNYNLQPLRLNEQGSAEAVYYGVRTIDQYREDLRYDGYNDEAVGAKVSTLFRPLPRLIMQTMFAEGLITDDAMKAEILKSGYDPSQVDVVVQALQNRKLVSYQDTVKSLVFSYFKDGFTDVNTAKNICAAFNIPAEQVAWILTLANYEFKYEQYQKLVVYVVDLFAKNELSAGDAVDSLVALGMDINRAKVLVAIKGITQAPAPPASTRAEILQSALALEVQVASS